MSYDALYWSSFKARRNSELSARTRTIRRKRGQLYSVSGAEPEETTTANLVRRLTSYDGGTAVAVTHSKSVEGSARRPVWAGTGADLVLEIRGRLTLAIQMKREGRAGKLTHWTAPQIVALNRWAKSRGILPCIGVIPGESLLAPRDCGGCCMSTPLVPCGARRPRKTPSFPQPWSGGLIGGGLFLASAPPTPASSCSTADLSDLVAVECLSCPRLSALGYSAHGAQTIAVPFVEGLLARLSTEEAGIAIDDDDDLTVGDDQEQIPSYCVAIDLDLVMTNWSGVAEEPPP
jgi:hypothetical protein